MDGSTGGSGSGQVNPVTARAHVFVGDLDAPVVDGGDHHHLVRVLRLAPGTDVTAGDGAGAGGPVGSPTDRPSRSPGRPSANPGRNRRSPLRSPW